MLHAPSQLSVRMPLSPPRKVRVPVTCAHYDQNVVKKLNKLFYSCRQLKVDELYSLCKGRRIQFSQDDNRLQLIIYGDHWKTDKRTWSGMTDILNAWSVGDQIRTKLADISDETYVIDLITESVD